MSKEKKKHGLLYKLAGAGTIKMGFEHTKDMLKSLKSESENNNYISETYDEALDRLGIPVEKRDSHVISIYQNLKISFIILSTAAIAFICSGFIYNLILGNILPSLLYLCVSLAFLSVAMNNSFRCFQIRRKQLGGLKEWAKQPKEWYPIALKKAWNN